MRRRELLLSVPFGALLGCVSPTGTPSTRGVGRARPGDAGWPSPAQWERLSQTVGGRLLRVTSPLEGCRSGVESCDAVFTRLRNPYDIGDEPGLTQSCGWVDAWTVAPSVYAVRAVNTADVVAAVDFARTHDLRLVVKGGGHSYQGTSNAPDSLLIWTRAMNGIVLHDAFVPAGCADTPRHAVTIGAGAMWLQAYDAVTTKGGRYVQGGGCATVGVAGLVQSGGFGSFSKGFGLAAAGLLEAEVVTADGAVRIANACTHPDLFWALKGGGGGTFGVVTRVTLATRDLPEQFGAASLTIRAKTDAGFAALIERAMLFYRERLLNPHWGEQFVFTTDNRWRVAMLFQGLEEQRNREIWQPLVDALQSRDDCFLEQPLRVISIPARRLWDATFLKQNAPGSIVADDRRDAPPGNVFWAGDRGQVGQFLHAYRSAWLPASSLQSPHALANALFAATRHWDVSLHFNKGLAGASEGDRARARDTAINPAAIDAFALAIIAAEGPPAFPGISGYEPDVATARRARAHVDAAMNEVLRIAPGAGSYLAEGDYFEPRWQQSYWGAASYSRLAAIKRKYDPGGLFFVHHGVGSEEWSADGFVRV